MVGNFSGQSLVIKSSQPILQNLMSEMQNIFVYINCLVTAQNWFPLNTLIKASNSIRNLHANSRNNVMLSFKFIFQVKATFFTSYLSRKIYFRYAFNIKRRYFCP